MEIPPPSPTEDQKPARYNYTATYSPEDNKLRLYSYSKLDTETYQRIYAAGFRSAPKQQLYFAPEWTPEREDLLIELCGEIADENRSLMSRAVERAQRYSQYSDNRMQDSNAARAAVDAIANNIPLGQSLSKGLHSRIHNGMQKTIDMWKTAQYWRGRGWASVANAERKESPEVRHRRIARLEAKQREWQRLRERGQEVLNVWKQEGLTLERFRGESGLEHAISADEWGELESGALTLQSLVPKKIEAHERAIVHYNRWVEQLGMRVEYERGALEDSGGIPASKFNIEVGGRVRWGSEWLIVLKVNRSNGAVTSLTCTPPRVLDGEKNYKMDISKVGDYRPPNPGDAQKVQAATKLPPLCNYPEGCGAQMTQAEWNSTHKDFHATLTIEANDQHGRHRRRSVTGLSGLAYVFLTDAKRIDPPAPPAPGT